MKKYVIVLLFLLNNILFIGCAQKETEIVFKDKLVCKVQEKQEKIPIAAIYICDADVLIYKKYVEATSAALEFYENQVDRNNKFCEEIRGLK